jgi:hypothetical protein
VVVFESTTETVSLDCPMPTLKVTVREASDALLFMLLFITDVALANLSEKDTEAFFAREVTLME